MTRKKVVSLNKPQCAKRLGTKINLTDVTLIYYVLGKVVQRTRPSVNPGLVRALFSPSIQAPIASAHLFICLQSGGTDRTGGGGREGGRGRWRDAREWSRVRASGSDASCHAGWGGDLVFALRSASFFKGGKGEDAQLEIFRFPLPAPFLEV